jgi:hypothetical protein
MFKPKKVVCNICNWEGQREEPDLYAPCPICDSQEIIVLEAKVNFGGEKTFPETISLEEIMAKDALDNMKETISKWGRTEVWEMIEKLVGNNKFSQIEIYLEAIKHLDEKNLGDNFPNIGGK